MKKIISFLAFLLIWHCSFAQPTLEQISLTDNATKKLMLNELIKSNPKNGVAHFLLAGILNRFAIYSRNVKKNSLENLYVSGHYFSLADSAYNEYGQAIQLLTASDIKKNEKYFQDYKRRDLRSGEFVIKYEDIVADIEIRRGRLSNILLEACRDANSSSGVPTISPSEPMSSDRLIVKPIGKYYALLIGVSDYSNYKLNLIRPSIDAEKLKDLLEQKYTFEKINLIYLKNPSRQEILNSLFGLRKKITKDDNLLIFYAGHGMFDEDAGQGYWWPRDADSESPSNWLSNSDLRDQIRGIKAAHILLIADACFSGGIFRTRGTEKIKEASHDIISLYKLPSRRAITSGSMTTVPDNSVFFDYLYYSLDNNHSQYIGSQALFDGFRLKVINNTLQVPQDGIIAETGDEGGDFIFIKRNN